MNSFTYSAPASRIIFGSGTIEQVNAEVERLAASQVLVLSTPNQKPDAEDLAARLGNKAAGVFSEATMHTPVHVTEKAMEVVKRQNIDCIVAIGGGSTVGLSKAIALRTDLPQIVLPTTYAGSEVTPILGETIGGAKFTQQSPKILPEVVIYDVDLTLQLPPAQSGASGINAMAHAVEALYAKDGNPITSLMAQEAIRVLSEALPKIVIAPSQREARSKALYGSWLCGTCLGAVGMSIHHKLCHTLGGTFDLPHAETHAVILPHAIAYNAPNIPDAIAALAEAMGTSDPARGIFELARKVGVPASLRELGMPFAGIDEATDRALSNPYWNPRRLERGPIRDLIERAYNGEPPKSG